MCKHIILVSIILYTYTYNRDGSCSVSRVFCHWVMKISIVALQSDDELSE